MFYKPTRDGQNLKTKMCGFHPTSPDTHYSPLACGFIKRPHPVISSSYSWSRKDFSRKTKKNLMFMPSFLILWCSIITDITLRSSAETLSLCESTPSIDNSKGGYLWCSHTFPALFIVNWEVRCEKLLTTTHLNNSLNSRINFLCMYGKRFKANIPLLVSICDSSP